MRVKAVIEGVEEMKVSLLLRIVNYISQDVFLNSFREASNMKSIRCAFA